MFPRCNEWRQYFDSILPANTGFKNKTSVTFVLCDGKYRYGMMALLYMRDEGTGRAVTRPGDTFCNNLYNAPTY